MNNNKKYKVKVQQGNEPAIMFQALVRTFRYLHEEEVVGLCPNCGQYLILSGKLCFGCGYDGHLCCKEEAQNDVEHYFDKEL